MIFTERLAEAFRIPAPRPVVQDLHGPWSPLGPCWPTPYRHAYGTRAFAEAVAAAPHPRATERWEHGVLVEVATEARRLELGARWGARRVAGARVGPVAVPPVSDEDRARLEAFAARGWLRLLVRAFEHVGCKAWHVGALDEAALAPWGDLGRAVLAARRRPRVAVAEELLAARGGDADRLHAELDAFDRGLDARGLGASWVAAEVPDHCLALWPLRNVMRLAERQGVLFREMRFDAFEAEDSFVPEMPVVCLDRDIYGGGFDHDLFHALVPALVTDDAAAFELGLLGIETVAQGYNSLVLASRHGGPAYEGHATWPGAALFEELERTFALPTVPEQLAAFRVLALVCHPDFDGDPVATCRRLTGSPASDAVLDAFLTRYRRYVRHDTGWLRALHPRYRTPVFVRWREALDDRLLATLEAAFDHLHAVTVALEDVDLRTWDDPRAGLVGQAMQADRWTLLKALELAHLLSLAGEAARPLRDEVEAVVATSRALFRAWDAHRVAVLALTGAPPAGRDPALLVALDAETASLAARAAARDHAFDRVVVRARQQQARGELPPPAIPADYATSFGELFTGVYYTPPVHVGSDWPGVA